MKGWLRAYPYLVTSVICLVIGVALGVFGLRAADRTAIDWPLTATAIKDLMTALGILGAGAWAAYLAARRRSLSTRAQLVHRYIRWKRSSEEFLRVYVQLRNIGDVQITPGHAWTYVQTPPTDIQATSASEDTWVDALRVAHPMQDEEVYLEPGGTEDYNFDFPIPFHSTILQLHTYVECDRRKHSAESPSGESRPDETLHNHWDLTTLVDLERRSAGEAKTPDLFSGGSASPRQPDSVWRKRRKRLRRLRRGSE
jgi:hypothetical protein